MRQKMLIIFPGGWPWPFPRTSVACQWQMRRRLWGFVSNYILMSCEKLAAHWLCRLNSKRRRKKSGLQWKFARVCAYNEGTDLRWPVLQVAGWLAPSQHTHIAQTTAPVIIRQQIRNILWPFFWAFQQTHIAPCCLGISASHKPGCGVSFVWLLYVTHYKFELTAEPLASCSFCLHLPKPIPILICWKIMWPNLKWERTGWKEQENLWCAVQSRFQCGTGNMPCNYPPHWRKHKYAVSISNLKPPQVCKVKQKKTCLCLKSHLQVVFFEGQPFACARHSWANKWKCPSELDDAHHIFV